MEKHYLIGQGDEEFRDIELTIVVASSPEEAIEKFGKQVAIKDEDFLDYVYGKVINDSFAETFFLHTREENALFTRTGHVNVSDEDFAKRVREYFGEHSEFADLYIAHFFGDDDENDNTTFPDDMLFYIWTNSNWTMLKAVNLADIERL